MKIVVVSGFFNPLHGGHLDMIEAAAEVGDKLIVIVNNDRQQLLKKDQVILDEHNRARLLGALRYVDEVRVAEDADPTVVQSLARIRTDYPGDELIFANGGDRDSARVTPEAAVCETHGIVMAYGIGGTSKADSSTRINQALGHNR